MINKESTAGDRLREELTRVFGSLTDAALAIKVQRGSYFRPYMKNTSSIGMKLQKKLVGVGLDVDYIMSGVRAGDFKESSDEDDLMIRKFEDLRYRSDQLNKDIVEFGVLLIKSKKKK